MHSADIVPRAATGRLDEYASSFRVVVVNGPRQAGKTTLLRLYRASHGGELRTLDDDQVLRSALQDPITFAREANRPLCIDEIQRGGDQLIRAIKIVVDERWQPGQFLLTGSTRFLTVPTLSESLAGRAGIIDLWPLSMSERAGTSRNVIDHVFADVQAARQGPSSWSREQYLRAILDGGYPEVLRMPGAVARRGWYDSYVETIVNRDVREFSRLQHADALSRLLELIAARSGSTLVTTDLARSLGGLTPDTVRSYLSYLETVFLVGYARPWSNNLTSKVARAPKVYVTDAGLAANLLQVTEAALRRPGHPALGGLVETFVFSELTKAAALAEVGTTVYHYRERDGREIDFVLEARDGRVVAIEVKASVSPAADATRSLTWLRDKLGDRFVQGIVLHLGAHTLPHGDRITAAPLSLLWGHAPL
ncbi:MAG TPA: ATP-binding protein [Candidatus Dormibacteraeota bacterium]|nr:ATP-binding protein [Candidatus Dormibacteraeota bacterium]